MKSIEIEMGRRTPEQDACYFDVRRIVGDIEHRSGRRISRDEFQQMYRSTLHRRLQQAVKPINDQMAQYIASRQWAHKIVFLDGALVDFEPRPLPEELGELDRLRKVIAERYTRGLE